MAVCGHPPSSDPPEPVTIQPARKAWCEEQKGLDLPACLSQFGELDARFESAWLEERGAALVNLPRLTLAGRDLRNVAALGTSFVYADLCGTRLERADLGYAQLERADLSAARLEGAVLRGARLEGARLSRARLARLRRFGCG